MDDSNPYEPPEVTESPTEQAIESLSDQNVKRLFVKSFVLRRFTFLFIFYSIVCLAISPQTNFLDSWLLYSTMGLLAGFGVITFIAAHQRPSWGRSFCFISSSLSLLLIPVGTVAGIILIVNLLGAERLFGTEKISHKRIMEEKLRRKYRAQLQTKPRPNIS